MSFTNALDGTELFLSSFSIQTTYILAFVSTTCHLYFVISLGINRQTTRLMGIVTAILKNIIKEMITMHSLCTHEERLVDY